jgi:hypothetical protein
MLPYPGYRALCWNFAALSFLILYTVDRTPSASRMASTYTQDNTNSVARNSDQAVSTFFNIKNSMV